eukprot:gnl/MRDRNA2_/MRDRNA2_111458_c0_seq1.p1 gnl/MRDRNA2_/MRDRNA2_111458_c0~~gnl/MRDRNA2_/MRDRNA2_111458_c0_seq1.p1  ORF type:complete len:163 (-),score=24.01 gnl/MRDRNA2_/MRDRNA2_111458_c0_seq1:16-504(-)
MPKVVTNRRMPVFTNMRQKVTDDTLNVVHCRKCDGPLLITDADLSNVPKRGTDGALVLDASKVVVRLSTVRNDQAALVRREKGIERQYTHSCSSCKQVIGYQSTPHSQELKLLYVVETAVKVPRRKTTPWTCRVCGYVCLNNAQLETHKKQRQHFWDEADEK